MAPFCIIKFYHHYQIPVLTKDVRSVDSFVESVVDGITMTHPLISIEFLSPCNIHRSWLRGHGSHLFRAHPEADISELLALISTLVIFTHAKLFDIKEPAWHFFFFGILHL